MGRGIAYWIFQRPRFCCCLPVRICVIIMAVLGFLFSGVLSIILWFEVATAHGLTSKERGAFIGGAIVETLFFLISCIGLIGLIVRKQKFVTAYAIGLYVHFLINLGAAGYLLSVILHATNKDTDVLCQHAISSNSQAQNQCSTLFNTIRGFYAALASIVLIIELYGAIVATRYVYQVRGEKREARMPRHIRGESDGRGGRVIPGFVRYDEVGGTKVYSTHYYPPAEGHARGPSAYSLASADFEGATPMGLYDPPSAGLPSSKYHGDLEDEDGYGQEEQGYGYEDMGHDHVAPEKIP